MDIESVRAKSAFSGQKHHSRQPENLSQRLIYHNHFALINQIPLHVPIKPIAPRIYQVETPEKLKPRSFDFKAFYCFINSLKC